MERELIIRHYNICAYKEARKGQEKKKEKKNHEKRREEKKKDNKARFFNSPQDPAVYVYSLALTSPSTFLAVAVASSFTVTFPLLSTPSPKKITSTVRSSLRPR